MNAARAMRILRPLFALSGAVLLLALAVTYSSRIDAAAHSRYEGALRHALVLDTRLGAQVTESALDLVPHFDDLVRTEDAIKASQRTLASPPAHLPEASRASTAAQIEAVDALYREKFAVLERFKTDRAVLRNAQRALPYSIERLHEQASPEALAVLAPQLNTLILSLTADSPSRHDAAACVLSRLSLDSAARDGCEPLPIATSPGLSELIQATRDQGTVALQRQQRVSERLAALMAVPTIEHLQEAEQHYHAAHREAAAWSALCLRVLEGAAAVFVLLGGGLIVARLQRDAAVLKETAERLTVALEALQAARERDKELARVKTLFTYMNTHEFRPWLAAVVSSSELLIEYGERLGEEKRQVQAHRILSAGNKMKRTVDRVLRFGRTESGVMDPEPSPVVISELVRDVIDEVRATIEDSRAIEVIDTTPPQARSLDQDLLRHILTNLLTNAFKYSPDTATVRFRIEDDGEVARFEIRDEGIGIPSDELDHLFEPFHRCSNVGKIEGSGLGLAIVKQSVEAHGGRLEVDSVLGQGTRFRVHIPHIKEPSGAPRPRH